MEEEWSGPASFSIFSKPYSLFLSATGSSVLFSFRELSVSSDPSNDLFSLGSCSELSGLDGAARAGDRLSRTMLEAPSIFGSDDSWDCSVEGKISRSRGRLALESMLGRDDSCDLRSFSRSSSIRLYISAGRIKGNGFGPEVLSDAGTAPVVEFEPDWRLGSRIGVSWLRLLLRGGNLFAGLSSREGWLLADNGGFIAL
jgi:hypothetical protein